MLRTLAGETNTPKHLANGEVARLLAALFGGMGDETGIYGSESGDAATVRQTGLRIVRGLTAAEQADLLACWIELWRGVVNSHRAFMEVETAISADSIEWTISRSAQVPAP